MVDTGDPVATKTRMVTAHSDLTVWWWMWVANHVCKRQTTHLFFPSIFIEHQLCTQLDSRYSSDQDRQTPCVMEGRINE